MCCYKRTDTVEIGTPLAERGLRTVQVEAGGPHRLPLPKNLGDHLPCLVLDAMNAHTAKRRHTEPSYPLSEKAHRALRTPWHGRLARKPLLILRCH
jgi:hypothetical protein